VILRVTVPDMNGSLKRITHFAGERNVGLGTLINDTIEFLLEGFKTGNGNNECSHNNLLGGENF
jgi:hypothetical protein